MVDGVHPEHYLKHTVLVFKKTFFQEKIFDEDDI